MNAVKRFFVKIVAGLLAVCIGVIAITIVLFNSIIAFGIGYFIAWVLQFTPIAEVISEGLNIVFNTSRFTAENLPLVLGVFGLLAAFFKPKLSKNKDKDE